MNTSIYNTEDERRKIIDGSYSTRVIQGRQRKHTEGSLEFNQNRAKMQKESPGSEPAILYADAVELVEKYKGKGNIKLHNSSQYPREIVDTNNVVGKTWVKSLGRYAQTQRIMIIYSSDGVHVVPISDYMG